MSIQDVEKEVEFRQKLVEALNWGDEGMDAKQLAVSLQYLGNAIADLIYFASKSVPKGRSDEFVNDVMNLFNSTLVQRIKDSFEVQEYMNRENVKI